MSPGRHLLVAGICSVAGLVDLATLAAVAPRWWRPPTAQEARVLEGVSLDVDEPEPSPTTSLDEPSLAAPAPTEVAQGRTDVGSSLAAQEPTHAAPTEVAPRGTDVGSSPVAHGEPSKVDRQPAHAEPSEAVPQAARAESSFVAPPTRKSTAPGVAQPSSAHSSVVASSKPTAQPSAAAPSVLTPQPTPTAPGNSGLSRDGAAQSSLLVVITFASEAVELSAEARTTLARVAPTLGRVRVEGHADPSGRDEGNEYFARARARVVARELERLGVPRGSMELVGRGASEPLDRARTPVARARNRRVELWQVAP